MIIKCSICGKYKNTYYKNRCERCYRLNIDWKSNHKIKYRRVSSRGYYIIHKPHYPYCDKIKGYVLEHRYIMYIYLSILNNKITYIEGLEIHHKDSNKLNNKIENLELITGSKHRSLTHKGNKYRLKDKSNRFCNLCYITNKDNEKWGNDINGYLCKNCIEIIRYFNKKLKT